MMLWLTAARPTYTAASIGIVSVPTSVHPAPSVHSSGSAGGVGGAAGGAGVPAVTVTLSNVDADVLRAFALAPPRPIITVGAIAIVSLPTHVQSTPSAD